MPTRPILAALVLMLVQPRSSPAQAAADTAAFVEGVAPEVLATVAIHPPAGALTCSQHSLHAGDPVILGDAAGIDCKVVRHVEGPGGRLPRFYRTDGRTNDDWYAWGAEVFAPFDGVVEAMHVNPVTNTPGTHGEGRATGIVFRRDDGTRVSYGHVAQPLVAVGDRVTAGQVVGRVGNNGFSWFPHLHVGAWKGREPLLIVLDPRAQAALVEREFRSSRKQ